MRVLIVGGLGYIGSSLIEKYKEFKTRDLKIDIIDKRFSPYILKRLPENFYFVQGDMKDDSIMDSLLSRKPDIIYLLAAEVQAESSINRERAIWENNFEATVKIIEKIPADTKIIFSSTGNVFGGIDENDKFMDLTEEDKPRPKYPYAESKRAVEKHLLSGNKNFAICRFGTNYGYSPGIRFDLVTNNFIKKALIGETIIIHGRGENFRPTVCVKDVARAMVFLSRSGKKEKGIFHIVNENLQIKNLASQIISSIHSNSKIEYIVKDVPFSSYNLSSEKIRKLGFEFKWNLNNAIEEMKRIFVCLSSGLER